MDDGNLRPGAQPYLLGDGQSYTGVEWKTAARRQPLYLRIVALNPDTGKLTWGFSASPHDTHDWDAAETPVLVDGDFHGKPHKMLMQASRNGYFFVLDRTNGKSLLTSTFWTGKLVSRSR